MDTTKPARHVDVRALAPEARHSTALAAYRALAVGGTLHLLDASDPIDLYRALHAIAPADFSWLYRSRGPDDWCVSVRKLGRIYSAGECCGVCGGGRRIEPALASGALEP